MISCGLARTHIWSTSYLFSFFTTTPQLTSAGPDYRKRLGQHSRHWWECTQILGYMRPLT
ncbi:hypothetical protein FRC10_004803 [Ceratobasidium sp. 414]|nr:hypothetical protein FRC10_004803 [Ceratobasidium sp. 414]